MVSSTGRIILQKETNLVTNEFQGGFPMQDSLAADGLS
jgi:hypothetical protein